MNKYILIQLGEKWLQSKIQRMKNLLKIAEPDEALYREIMLSLGYPKNKVQFLELALMTPFKEIRILKEKEKIEKALLYRAGFIDLKDGLPDSFDFSLRMDKSVWDFKKIRPFNYPDKRIKGISHLLSQSSYNGIVNYFLERIRFILKEWKCNINDDFGKNSKSYVKRIMSFEGIGIERKREIFFNIILPFSIAFVGEKDKEVVEFLNVIFSTHPPLSENSIIKRFKSIIAEEDYPKLNISTKTYFGINLLLKEEFLKK